MTAKKDWQGRKGVQLPPMKRAVWKQIDASRLKHNSVWVRMKEEKLATDALLDELEEKFSTKKVRAAAPVMPSTSGEEIKKRQLRILDDKTSKNLNIFIRWQRGSVENLPQNLLRLDSPALSCAVVEQLQKCLPPASVLAKFRPLAGQVAELDESEALLVRLSSLRRLHARLDCLVFKLRFEETVSELKPDLAAVTEALKRVRDSERLPRLLELVLLLGNFLNTGSKFARCLGFELSYLNKLSTTRDRDDRSLLHFLVRNVDERFPKLLALPEELRCLERAARVSEERLRAGVDAVKSQVRKLDSCLASWDRGDDGDRFLDIMTPFMKRTLAESDLLAAMIDRMDAQFRSVADYLAFDPARYSFEELFADLKSFCDSITKAIADNRRQKLLHERQERAKAVERERKKKRERRRTSRPAVEEGEGAMDSLLEQLKSGAAFTSGRKGEGTRGGQIHSERVAGRTPRSPLRPLNFDEEDRELTEAEVFLERLKKW